MEQEIQRLIHSKWPDLEYVEDVGSGSYGNVYHMIRRDLAGTFDSAIKVIIIPDSDAEIAQIRQEGYTPEQTFSYFKNIVSDCAAEIRFMEALRGKANITAIEDYAIIHPDDKMVWYILIRMEYLHKIDYPDMTENDIVHLGIDICTALEECRKMDVVHRDIKPDNILVDKTGQYKLGDFGIAKKLEHNSTFSMKCTPNYSAPEIVKAQMKHADIDAAARADIYSLGLVMYWISNNCRLPHMPEKQIFSREDRENALFKRIQGEPFPPPRNVSPWLQNIIMKACNYDANDRFNDAAEMKKELLRGSTGAQEETRKPLMISVLCAVLACCIFSTWLFLNRKSKTGDDTGYQDSAVIKSETISTTHETSTEFEVIDSNVQDTDKETETGIEQTAESKRFSEATTHLISDTPAPAPAIPRLVPSIEYAEIKTSVTVESLSSRSGPSTQYTGCGTYKNTEGKSVTALSRQEDSASLTWVEIEMKNGAELKRLWVGAKRLGLSQKQLEALPSGPESACYSGIINRKVTPSFGPGSSYLVYTIRQYAAGDTVQVFGEYNGYYLVESSVADQADKKTSLFRSWVPAAAVSLD